MTPLDRSASSLGQVRVGPAVGSGRQVVVDEELRIARFVRDDGQALLCIWSSHPLSGDFRPRRTAFTLGRPLSARPILVDPMTGESRELEQSDRSQIELDGRDYPLFILE